MARSRADLQLYRFKASCCPPKRVSIVENLEMQSEGVYEVKARR